MLALRMSDALPGGHKEAGGRTTHASPAARALDPSPEEVSQPVCTIPCAPACIWTYEPAFGSPLGELGMRGVREPNVQAVWQLLYLSDLLLTY